MEFLDSKLEKVSVMVDLFYFTYLEITMQILNLNIVVFLIFFIITVYQYPKQDGFHRIYYIFFSS